MAVTGDVPPEIWHEVLIYLELLDLLGLRLVCRWMSDVVDDSSFSQYRLECFCSGVHDDLRPGLSYSERLDLLRKREIAWRSLSPQRRISIPIPFEPSGIYDFTGGSLVLGRSANPEHSRTTGYAVLRLPSRGEKLRPWKHFELNMDVIDFGLNVYEHDLNVVVVMREVNNQPLGGQNLNIMLATFELHFLSFSTGLPHPKAARPCIILRHSALVIHRATTLVEIVGDYVIVLLVFPFMVGMRLDTLSLVNWKTGMGSTLPRFESQTYRGFVFLNATTLMLPNSRTLAIDIFRIEEIPETGEVSLQLVCVLRLPETHPEVRIAGCQCRAEPNILGPGSTPAVPPASSRPFRDSPESAVVIISLFLAFAPNSSTSVTIIVHRATLLDAADAATEIGRSISDPIPYNEWGPEVTSWFEADASWITQTAGQRFAYISHDSSYHAIRVCDFNQRNVRRQIARSGLERVRENRNSVKVVTGMRRLDLGYWFSEPIRFSLPYIESTLEEPCMGAGVLLDEERILSVTTPNISIQGVEELYFG